MGSMLQFRNQIARANEAKIRQVIAEVILKSPEVKRAKIEEFKAGLRPDGNIIGVYRSNEYRRQKQSMNSQAGGTVDLILTGSFTDKLFLQNPRPSEFIFESTDSKSNDLFAKYGDDLRGLNSKTFRDTEILFLKDKYIPAIRNLIFG